MSPAILLSGPVSKGLDYATVAADLVVPSPDDVHRTEVPNGRAPFCETGPAMVYQLIGEWIVFHQQRGNIRDDLDPQRLAVLFHDMLVGEHLLSWLTSASSDKDRVKRVERTVQLAVTVFLQGCSPRPHTSR
jgi:hypothetical protein